MQKVASRIVPNDVLKSEALQKIMGDYMYEDEYDDASDPVEPSLSPQVMYRPSPRVKAAIASTALVAAGAAANTGWLPAWLSWKVALAGVVIAIVAYVCVRYWRLMRTKGVSYAFAAAIPPLRPLMAPIAGVSGDVMLAEIEAFYLPKLDQSAKPKSKVTIQSPKKSVEVAVSEQQQPQIDRAALIEQLLADGLASNHNHGHPAPVQDETPVSGTPAQQQAATGDTQHA